jgi:hypothetical protein
VNQGILCGLTPNRRYFIAGIGLESLVQTLWSRATDGSKAILVAEIFDWKT